MKATWPQHRFPYLIVAALGLAGGAAQARDLQALAGIVEPAYTAMNYAVVCTRNQPNFLRRASGSRGHVLQYAEHVKDEVIDQLTEDEAKSVLRSAADAARVTVLREIRRLEDPNAHWTIANIATWCESEALPFISRFIATHDTDHQRVLLMITQSKR